MSHLPVSIQSTFTSVFQLAGFSQEKITEELEALEKELFSRFVALALKKLPDSERSQAVSLINQQNAEAANKKIEEWYNQAEMEAMWEKLINEMLAEVAHNLYQDADEETKKRMEEKIKPEVLKGVV